MAVWTFFDYLEERGQCAIREWLDSLPVKARVKIEERIRYLKNLQVFEPKFVTPLQEDTDILEIRAESGNVQYRPLGCYGPERKEFTLLVGAIEKGGKLEPRSVVKTAASRRKIVLADKKDRKRTHEHC